MAVDNPLEQKDNQAEAVDIHHTAEEVDIVGYFLQAEGSHSLEAVPCLYPRETTVRPNGFKLLWFLFASLP